MLQADAYDDVLGHVDVLMSMLQQCHLSILSVLRLLRLNAALQCLEGSAQIRCNVPAPDLQRTC